MPRRFIVIMRIPALLSTLVLAVIVLTPAQAAMFTVSITKSGFAPSAVTIGPGDTVTWTNADTSSHQVTSKDAGFTSPLLKPGESFSYTYRNAGRFAYQDSTAKKNRGTVTVQSATGGGASATVTETASRTTVVYGAAVTLSGVVSSKNAGETISVLASSYGASGFASLGSAVSVADGRWSFLVKPRIRTAYEARWKAATGAPASSPPVTIRVRPHVALGVRATSGRVVTFSTKARTARPLGGRFVLLQRRNAFGQWVSLRRVTLGATSSAKFSVTLPKGRSKVRVFIPQKQAGPGYLSGASRALLLSR